MGFAFGKSGIVKHEHSKIISVLLTYLIIPCTVFNSMAKGFTTEYLKNYYVMIIISAVLVFIFIILGTLAAKLFSKNAYERKVYTYTFVTPNYGYIGYAIAEGVYGAEGLLNLIVFSLPMAFFVYTLGYSLLTNQKFTLKKIFNPIIIALLLGIVVGLTGFKVPAVFSSIINSSAACMSPLAMLLTGIAISEFDIKGLIGDYKAYIVAVLRLIVFPLSVFLVLKPFFNEDIVRTAVLLYSMPCGMNTIVFAKAVNENYRLGAEFALISNVLAIITIPLILMLI